MISEPGELCVHVALNQSSSEPPLKILGSVRFGALLRDLSSVGALTLHNNWLKGNKCENTLTYLVMKWLTSFSAH